MTEILIWMVSWLAINLITWLSGKTGVSKTYVSVLLCLLIWVICYLWQILINKYSIQRDEIVAFATWSYWFSQIVWNLYNKIKEEK